MTKLSAHDYDYRLLKGSHEFPGPERGACLNEVAVVAAGLDYRAILSADDCPPCFSRPIAAYVIGINDGMPIEIRQKLKRFVLRLAGSADCAEIEQRRACYIVVETVRRILPIALRTNGMSDQARLCADVAPFDLTSACAAAKASAVWGTSWETFAVEVAVDAVAKAIDDIPNPTMAAESAARAAARAAIDAPLIWSITIDIIDGALAIGAHAPPIPDADAIVRLGQVFGTREAEVTA